MIYDEKKFEEFRGLAITDVSELEVGKKYYSNFWPDTPIFVYELISHAEHSFRVFNDEFSENASKELRWIRIGNDLTDISFYTSLRDNNVGASYNPWLLFSNKEDCDRCVEELTIRY